jgi:outer membrane protein TolC
VRRSLCILLVAAAALHADVLSLSDAEVAAATVSFEMRAKYFEKQSKEAEEWNAIAGYLPKADYEWTYRRMDSRTVDSTNAAFDRIGDLFRATRDIVGTLSPFDSAAISSRYPSVFDTGVTPFRPVQLYTNTFSHDLMVTQPISNGGMEIWAIAIARNVMKATLLQQEAARQDAIYAARKAYFDALAARERTIVAGQALSWSRQNLAKAQSRTESGALPITDVLRWEADQTAKQAELLQAQAVERYLLLNLYQTMGTVVDRADTAVELQPVPVFEQWYARGPAATSGSIDSNLTVQMVQTYTHVTELAKRIEVGKFLPRLNGFFKYMWNDTNAYTFAGRQGWATGVVATVPLTSGFRSLTSYRKAKYDNMKMVVDEQKVRNQLAVNLNRIGLFYAAAYENVSAARKLLALVERQLTMMQDRYEAGLVNQSQLLEIELLGRQARIGYIMKLFECLLLDAEYQKTIGKLEVSS